jgi:uridine phosphorylase
MAIHLKGIKPEDLGEVTLLVGDPGRVKVISQIIDEPNLIVENREYILMNGFWQGKKVSICSTGIGISSTEIAVIELIEQGAKFLVRVGGCGAWKKNINPGDLIINHAMAREPGILTTYSIDSFPAVADPVLVNTLRDTALANGFKVHYGIGLTAQSYYLGQGRKPKISGGPNVSDLMKYWEDRSILNCEMETAAIYMLAAIYGVRTANCLVVHVNRVSTQWVSDEEYHDIHIKAANMVLEACFEAINKSN